MYNRMKKRPNILIIVSDQLNIDSIHAYRYHFTHEAYGCHWIKTPNLDRMVSNGYSFMESHSNNPLSSPGRSCIFTSRYSTETGITYNNIGIDEAVSNMGQWFEKYCDYDRVYCGKWHAGGKWNYPDIDGNRKIPGFDTIPVGVLGTGDFNDFQVSGALRGYIQNHGYDKPFLAVAGLMNPHDICYWTIWDRGRRLVPDQDLFKLGDSLPPLPPNFHFDFEDPEPQMQRNDRTEIEWKNYIYDYLRMVEKLDQDIGRLLEAVDGRKDQTLVILTSDHGEGAGRHRRVQKWHPFEQSVKVPLIYYMPEAIRKGVIDKEHIICQLNLMPTVCDFAGIPIPPESQAKSLRTLLLNDNSSMVLDTAIIEFRHIARIVRKGDFKYVKYYEFSGDQDKPFIRKSDGQAEKFTPCVGRERYVESSKRLLFNLKEDPWETKDLSKNNNYHAIMEELELVLINQFELAVKPGSHFDRN
jgi:arylsulfatase A-like enzyme